MGVFRLAIARDIVAAATAVHAIPIWGRTDRMIVISIFFALCICVEHIYNMSWLRHIPKIMIMHQMI
jgi:hypothetical protein